MEWQDDDLKSGYLNIMEYYPKTGYLDFCKKYPSKGGDKNMINKLKSKWVWVSALAIIVMFLRKYGILETDIEFIETVVNSVLVILIGLGVLNNPDQEKF